MVSPRSIKRLLPLLIGIGAGLLALMALLLTHATHPSPSPLSKPVGTSTLSHGGSQPAR